MDEEFSVGDEAYYISWVIAGVDHFAKVKVVYVNMQEAMPYGIEFTEEIQYRHDCFDGGCIGHCAFVFEADITKDKARVLEYILSKK